MALTTLGRMVSATPQSSAVEPFDDLTAWSGTAHHQIVASPSVVGNALDHDHPSGTGFDGIESQVGDGLSDYPAPGETWRWYRRFSSAGDDSNNRIGMQGSTGARYQVNTSPFDGNIQLYSYDGSTFTELASTTFSWSVDTWYDIEFVWGASGDLEVNVMNTDETVLASLGPVNDTTVTSEGGIAFYGTNQNSNATNIYTDELRRVA